MSSEVSGAEPLFESDAVSPDGMKSSVKTAAASQSTQGDKSW